MHAIERRKILPGVTVLFLAKLVQKHAVAISTWLVSQPGRAVLGRTELGLENPITVLRAVDCLYTALSILFLLKSDVDSERLVQTLLILPVRNRNLLDVAVLPEELLFAKSAQQLVLPHCWCKTCHVNEVLLDNADADEVLARIFLRFASLYLSLALYLGTFLLLLLEVGTELGLPVMTLVRAFIDQLDPEGVEDALLNSDSLVLYCLVVVDSPTCWTKTIHIVLDVVIAKLADLV